MNKVTLTVAAWVLGSVFSGAVFAQNHAATHDIKSLVAEGQSAALSEQINRQNVSASSHLYVTPALRPLLADGQSAGMVEQVMTYHTQTPSFQSNAQAGNHLKLVAEGASEALKQHIEQL